MPAHLWTLSCNTPAAVHISLGLSLVQRQEPWLSIVSADKLLLDATQHITRHPWQWTWYNRKAITHLPQGLWYYRFNAL